MNKRTDYLGSEIADLVERRWNKNFSNEVMYVVGDEWYAGNLSYHLSLETNHPAARAPAPAQAQARSSAATEAAPS